MAKEIPAGLYTKKTYVYAPTLVFSRGLASNYQIYVGDDPSYEFLKGDAIVVSSSFKEIDAGIAEAIWRTKCKTFSCNELSWYETINSPNQNITTVDFFTSSQSDLKIEIEQSSETIITEG